MSLLEIQALPQTPQEWAGWSFAHEAHHRDVNRVIWQLHGMTLPDFPLDPFRPEGDTSVWLYHHAVSHNNINAVLKQQDQLLVAVDWQDDDSVQDWMAANFVDHLKWSQTFGVG